MGIDQARLTDYDSVFTELLLGIAADILRSFGSAFGSKHLAIVGGAVPTLLARELPLGLEKHSGTADLDFHLSLHLMDGETADYYDAIIDGLRSLGLHPYKDGKRLIQWRWVGSYRGVQLRVEFLCPARQRGGRPEGPALGTPAETNIGPCGEITALAIGYGHLVFEDTIIIERRVKTSRGSLSFEFPVAGLTSWLCLKTDALMRRDKPKYSYDVVWLIDALGPAEAAKQITKSPLLTGKYSEEVKQQITRLINDQFYDINSIGPRSYADFLLADPGFRERRHALGSIASLGRKLSEQGYLSLNKY